MDFGTGKRRSVGASNGVGGELPTSQHRARLGQCVVRYDTLEDAQPRSAECLLGFPALQKAAEGSLRLSGTAMSPL